MSIRKVLDHRETISSEECFEGNTVYLNDKGQLHREDGPVRRPDLEHLILKDPWWAADYAAHNVRGRWSEAENIIKTDAVSARWYATFALKGRWPEGEDVIFGDMNAQEQKEYYLSFLKKQNYLDEQKIEWLSQEGRTENLLEVLAYLGWPKGMEPSESLGSLEPLLPEIVRYFHSAEEKVNQHGNGVFQTVPHLSIGRWDIFLEDGKVWFKKWQESSIGKILVLQKFPKSVKETLEDVSAHPHILDEGPYPWPKHTSRFEVFKKWLLEESTHECH